MNYLKNLVSLLIIYSFLNSIEANTVHDLAALNRVYNQIDALKSENDNLKLRLELIELQMGKLADFVTGIDQKLQTIDESFEKLHLALKSQFELRNAPNVAADLCRTISGTKHDNSIETIVDNINVESPFEETLIGNVTKKTHIGDQLQTGLPQNETVFMADINGNGVTKICKTNLDKCLTCSDIVLPTSCDNTGSKACWDNKCYIQNRLYGPTSFWVSCDATTYDGGWTVIQRRINGSVDFDRGWADYKEGFGELDGEFWIGLDKLHALTNTLGPVELYVRLTYCGDVEKYEKYDSFAIGGEETNYVLRELGTYSGTAGDSLGKLKNMKFTTRDRDNDNYNGNCAEIRKGAWWYDSSTSNLNSCYFGAGRSTIVGQFIGETLHLVNEYSMEFAQMMIRPRKIAIPRSN